MDTNERTNEQNALSSISSSCWVAELHSSMMQNHASYRIELDRQLTTTRTISQHIQTHYPNFIEMVANQTCRYSIFHDVCSSGSRKSISVASFARTDGKCSVTSSINQLISDAMHRQQHKIDRSDFEREFEQLVDASQTDKRARSIARRRRRRCRHRR